MTPIRPSGEIESLSRGSARTFTANSRGVARRELQTAPRVADLLQHHAQICTQDIFSDVTRVELGDCCKNSGEHCTVNLLPEHHERVPELSLADLARNKPQDGIEHQLVALRAWFHDRGLFHE